MQATKAELPPTGVAELVGGVFCKAKGYQFDSWSGHMPGLQIWSLVGVYERQPINVSLSVSLSLSLKVKIIKSFKNFS